jgi:hypothetical protein
MNPHRTYRQLHRLAKSRLALSTVVTTLIILVIAVLLAGVVTYFAVNVTSTRVQEENLALTKQHVWFDAASGKAQAAIMVINAGGRDVAIDKLTVRGQICAWSKVYYSLISGAVTGDLSYSSTLSDGGSILVGGQDRVFKKATTDITIQSGKTLVIYMDNPDSISVNDVGLTVSVNIFTSQAMYYKETNVQGTSGTTTTTTGTDDTIAIGAQAVYTSDNGDGNPADVIGVGLQNTRSTSIVITKDDLIVNDVPVKCVAFFATTEGSAPQEGAAMESVTIQPGEVMLLLFYGRGAYITGIDEEDWPSVCLNIGGVHSTTTTAQVMEQVVAIDGPIYIPQ